MPEPTGQHTHILHQERATKKVTGEKPCGADVSMMTKVVSVQTKEDLKALHELHELHHTVIG